MICDTECSMSSVIIKTHLHIDAYNFNYIDRWIPKTYIFIDYLIYFLLLNLKFN